MILFNKVEGYLTDFFFFGRLDRYDFPSLTMFVSSVLGLLPWCSSNGVDFDPICIVNRITCNALFTLSVRLIPSSKFAIIKLFMVCIALSTTPFPVCARGVQYSISIFRFLQNSRYSFETIAPPLSDLTFSGIPYKFKIGDKKFVTSLVSAVLHTFTVGHLLNLSTAIAISICTSPCIFLLCNFPVKSICNSWPGSVRFSSYRNIFSVIDI